MISSAAHTSVEPFIVDIVPVRTESYTLSLPIAEALTSLASTPMTTETATDPTNSLLTCTLNLQLPSDPNSTLAEGHPWPPTIIILTIAAIILFGLTLLSAILCFLFFIRSCGKCPNCSGYKEKPKKWKRKDIEHATRGVVEEYLRESDLGRSGENSQFRVKMDRMKALASLEGLSSVTGSVDSEEEAKEKMKHLPEYTQIDDWLQTPPTVQMGTGAAEVCRSSKDTNETHMVGIYPGNPATYSAYLRDFLAACEAENQHSPDVAEEKTFTELCSMLNIACQDHVQLGITDRSQEAVKVQSEKPGRVAISINIISILAGMPGGK